MGILHYRRFFQVNFGVNTVPHGDCPSEYEHCHLPRCVGDAVASGLRQGDPCEVGTALAILPIVSFSLLLRARLQLRGRGDGGQGQDGRRYAAVPAVYEASSAAAVLPTRKDPLRRVGNGAHAHLLGCSQERQPQVGEAG